MKRCAACGSLSQDAEPTCGVCGTSLLGVQTESYSEGRKAPRPLGVKLISAFSVFSGIFALYVSALLLVFALDYPTFLLGWIVGFSSIPNFILGVGMYRGNGWARTFGMGFFVFSVLTSLYAVARGYYQSIVEVPIGLLIIYYLNKLDVQWFFGRTRSIR